MMDFTFNAQQFVDFDHLQETTELDSDMFFEISHEAHERGTNSIQTDRPLDVSETIDPLIDEEIMDAMLDSPPNLRRSMSVGFLNLNEIPNEIENLCGSVDEMTISTKETPIDARKLSRKKSFNSNRNLNNKPDSSRKYSSNEKLNRLNGRLKIQNKTTIPQSPQLLTKTRVRPISVLSQADREKLLMEEAKKFKFKAQPLNKRILGPLKPRIDYQNKEMIKPEPFKLTETIKKPPSPAKILPANFHAKPLPKFYKSNEFINGSESKNMEIKQKSLDDISNSKFKTVPKPFSFEERDKISVKRKEEQIHQLLEEEKRAREFYANPLPNFLKNKHNDSHNNTIRTNKSEENDSTTHTFKARPANILYIPPFQPKKPERILLPLNDFQLNTERRAKERESFEEHLREVEELKKEFIEKDKNERLRFEIEERARLRKEAEVKAHPIRKYKPVKTITPKEFTIPETPNCFRGKNKENNY